MKPLSFDLPGKPKQTDKFLDEQIIPEPDLMPDMNDVVHKESNEPYPNFIRDELEIKYFDNLYNKLKLAGTPVQSSEFDGLGMLAFNLSLVDKCNHSVRTFGMTMLVNGDRKPITKRNPALDVLKDAQAAVRFWAQQFNITPKSKGKHAGGKVGLDDFNDI